MADGRMQNQPQDQGGNPMGNFGFSPHDPQEFAGMLKGEIDRRIYELDKLQDAYDVLMGVEPDGSENENYGRAPQGFDTQVAVPTSQGDQQFDSQNAPNLGPTQGQGGAYSAQRDSGQQGIVMDKSGTIDERTKEGRLATDAQGYSEQDLRKMLRQAPRKTTDNQSIDLRTEQGRALRAAGYVDDNGRPTVQVQGMRYTRRPQGGMQSRGGNRNPDGGYR